MLDLTYGRVHAKQKQDRSLIRKRLFISMKNTFLQSEGIPRDDFKYLRPLRHVFHILLNIQNRMIERSLAHLLWKGSSHRVSKEFQVGSQVLVLGRDFGGSNSSAVENFLHHLNQILERHLCTVTYRKRIGNTLFGNTRWVREQIKDVQPREVIFLDPQLLGLPGLLGLLSIVRLHREFVRNSRRLRLVLYDILDHQGQIFAPFVSWLGYSTLYIASAAHEARKFFGVVNSYGPAPELSVTAMDVDAGRLLQSRPVDIHLPRPSYEPRATVVQHVLEWIKPEVNYAIGGSFTTHEQFRASLKDTKVVLVTNAMIVKTVGRFPYPQGPKHHLVTYNVEALASGSVLLSEDCVAIREILEPEKHFIPYSSVAGLQGLIDNIADLPYEHQATAQGGTQVLINRINEQPALHAWLKLHASQ